MKPLTSSRRWPLLVLPVLGCIALLMLVVLMFGLGDVEDSFKRFANALLTSFSATAAILAVAMWSYADSREKPLSAVIAMLAMAAVGAILTIALLSYGSDLLLEANGSALAQILYNIVQLLVIISALVIAGGLVLGIAFALLSKRSVSSLFDEEE